MLKSLIKLVAGLLAGGSAQTAQPTPTPTPTPPKTAPTPTAQKTAPTPTPQVKDASAWMKWAWHEATDGIPAEPNHDNRGPVIQRYIDLAHCGSQGDPYCAIFVNAALEQAGIRGTRSALARSFERDKNFVKLSGPAWGAITVFWRGSKSSGTGHAAFYDSETATYVYTLGANQNDDCNVSPFRKEGATFGLVGFYWPASLPLPKVGAIQHGANTATAANLKDTKAT